jgi:hypothetical protein
MDGTPWLKRRQKTEFRRQTYIALGMILAKTVRECGGSDGAREGPSDGGEEKWVRLEISIFGFERANRHF